jgi:hypothetical protein
MIGSTSEFFRKVDRAKIPHIVNDQKPSNILIKRRFPRARYIDILIEHRI